MALTHISLIASAGDAIHGRRKSNESLPFCLYYFSFLVYLSALISISLPSSAPITFNVPFMVSIKPLVLNHHFHCHGLIFRWGKQDLRNYHSTVFRKKCVNNLCWWFIVGPRWSTSTFT